MIEITHAPEDGKEKVRKIPKNIRQIGNTSGYAKIYMEDMVYQFLSEGGIEEEGHLVTYLLLGEEFYQNNEQYIFIRSAIEVENISYNREFPVFSEDVWNEIYRTIRKYFLEEKILGWAENRKGGRLDYCSDMETVCRRHFHGENQIVLFFDTVDEEEIIYFSHNGRYVKKEGFHLYYEKNSGFCDYLSEYHERKDRLREKRKQEWMIQERRRLEEEERRSRELRRERLQEESQGRKTEGTAPEQGKKDPRSEAGEELEKRFREEQENSIPEFSRSRRIRNGERSGSWPAKGTKERFFRSPGWEEDTVSRYRDLLREKDTSSSSKISRTAAAAVVLVILGAFAIQNYTQLENMEDAVDAIAQQQAKEDVLETISKTAGELTEGKKEQGQAGEKSSDQNTQTPDQNTQTPDQNTQTPDQGTTNSADTHTDASAQTSASTNEYLAQGFYVVQQGDKLLDISRKVYGNDQMVAAICEANGITDINHIQTGDRLTLPSPR